MKVDYLSEKIALAVSGGMDSMVMLHLYMESGADFFVINIEHGIRGERSVADSEFVKGFCDGHGITCHVERIDALSYAEEKKISVELAARELRYSVFNQFLLSGKAQRIALAHHADDNAETVLMRIFRGTGLRGLRGITDRDSYIRPLIKYTREDIAKYAEEHAVPYVVDETNVDSAYTRNFVRNEVIPLVKTRYPGVVGTIARMSETMAEIDAFLQKNAKKWQLSDDGYVIPDLFGAEDIIVKYSLSALLRDMGQFVDMEAVNFADVIALRGKKNNSSVDLPFGIVATKFDSDLHVSRKKESVFTPTEFSPDGEYAYGGQTVRFVPADGMVRGLTFDGDKVSGCVVRTRQDGDKFHRVNGKNKLLSDFLNEKKLVKQEKDSLLVLAKGSEVFVILGLEVGEGAKIDENTKKILLTVKEKIYL